MKNRIPFLFLVMTASSFDTLQATHKEAGHDYDYPLASLAGIPNEVKMLILYQLVHAGSVQEAKQSLRSLQLTNKTFKSLVDTDLKDVALLFKLVHENNIFRALKDYRALQAKQDSPIRAFVPDAQFFAKKFDLTPATMEKILKINDEALQKYYQEHEKDVSIMFPWGINKNLIDELDIERIYATLAIYFEEGLDQQRLLKINEGLLKTAQWKKPRFTPEIEKRLDEAKLLDIAKLFLAAGADVNYNTGSETPLTAAVSRRNRDMIKLLMAAGADMFAEVMSNNPLKETKNALTKAEHDPSLSKFIYNEYLKHRNATAKK